MRSKHRFFHRLLAGMLIGAVSGAGYWINVTAAPSEVRDRGLQREPPAAPASVGETPIPRPETGLHTADINQMVLTHDGRLLTVSDDKTARLWHLNPTRGLSRMENQNASQVLRVPIASRNEGKLYAVAASPVKNRAVVAGSTGLDKGEPASAYYVLDLESGQLIASVSAVPGSVHALAYSQDGRYLAIGSGSGWLRIVDLQDKSKPTAFYDSPDSACADEVTAIRFLHDGRLVSACQDGQVRLYDAAFHLLKTYRFPAGQHPWRLAVSPKEDQIAVGSRDNATVSRFSLPNLEPLPPLQGDPKQRGALSVVAWKGDEIFAAGTYGDKQGVKYLRTWNLATQKAREWSLAGNTVNDLTPLPDGRIAYATTEPSIGFIDAVAGQASATYNRPIADFRDAFEGAFAVSEDGTIVDFGLAQHGRSPMRFDLAHRTLTRDPAPRPDLRKPKVPVELKNWRNSPRPTLASKPLALSQNERSLSAASTPYGGVLVGADYSLQLWRGGKQVWNIDTPGPAWAVQLTPNGRLAVAALGDGTIRWYEAATGKELLAVFVTTRGDWLLWNPNGYFDHSEGAADLIGYHLNQGRGAPPRFVSSGQMHERFYRPDLAAAAVLGTGPAPVASDNVGAVVAQHRAPEVKLLAWCVQGKCTDATVSSGILPKIEVDAAEVTLRFSLKDQGSGVGDLVLRRNVATVATRGLSRMESNPKVPGVVDRTVQLEPGENWISATAFDVTQTVDAGEAVRLPITYRAVSDKPALYLVSVGINQYSRETAPALANRDLKNAVSDAKGIADKLSKDSTGFFSEIKPPALLLDNQARLVDIKEALRWVANQARPQDLVVLFLAGHGIAIDGRYYFLPYDAKVSGNPSNDEIKTSSLAQSVLSELIYALPTSRVAVLIDSCNSGAFAVPDSLFRQTQDRAWTGSMAQNTGRFILAATSSEQEALDGINGHGVFTSVVLGGLDGKADKIEGNNNKEVDVVELSRYAKRQVPSEARSIAPNHAQNVSGFFMGIDFFPLNRLTP